MRRSKTKKLERKSKATANVQLKKDLKIKQKEKEEKMKAWLNLPQEEWSEARKKHALKNDV